MNTIILDQEGGMMSELTNRFRDRYSVRRVFAAVDDHTTTGLVEAHIRLTRITTLKLWSDVRKQAIPVTQEDCVIESATLGNLITNVNGSTPALAPLGYQPRDYYQMDSDTIESHAGALNTALDASEAQLRLRMLAKQNILKSIVEARMSKAANAHVEKRDLTQLQHGSKTRHQRSIRMARSMQTT